MCGMFGIVIKVFHRSQHVKKQVELGFEVPPLPLTNSLALRKAGNLVMSFLSHLHDGDNCVCLTELHLKVTVWNGWHKAGTHHGRHNH